MDEAGKTRRGPIDEVRDIGCIAHVRSPVIDRRQIGQIEGYVGDR